MEHETKILHFDEFATNLNSIFDEVEAQGESVTVERGGQFFTLAPKELGGEHESQRGLTAHDPIWDIIGVGRSSKPGTDVSVNTHAYLAKAALAEFDDTEQEGERHTNTPSTSSTTT